MIDLVQTLSKTELSRKDKILLILVENGDIPKKISEIKSIGKNNGLMEIDKWNVSMVLSSLKGKATKIKEGWILTNQGKDYLNKSGFLKIKPLVNSQNELLAEASKIKTNYVKEFVNEAIRALEFGLLRSSVVISWVGSMSLLYDYVVKNKLTEFNMEAKRRNDKWKDASNIDGLSRMKEYDFLQILEAISIIGKSTKCELEQALNLRNSCGHPSTLKIGVKKIEAHIEILLLNVFRKFS